MDAAGGSITKAFNGQGASPCPNDDQEFFNWSTRLTHGNLFCSDGGEGVFSQAERLECRQEAPIVSPDPHNAISGAQMLKDFAQQASDVAAFLSPQSSPHYKTVALGHNDICAGGIEKVGPGCGEGDDQDPAN